MAALTKQRADWLVRYQAVLLLALPVVWSCFVWSPGFFTDPDSYFHIGVTRRFLEHGWLRELPWLPHTTLATPFPDMYLGQHVWLAPLVALFEPMTALRLGIVGASFACATSLYLVLRRRGVVLAAPWIVGGMLACPLALTYAVFLKGATTFLVLLPWFVDAVWARARRRTFVLAWVSVYLYVGATVLVPFAIVHLLVMRWWDGEWDAGCVVATIAGIVAGMIINPFWPAHWGYVAAELRTVFERDPALVPGEYRGAEWMMLTGQMLVHLAGGALVAWGIVLVRQLGRASRVSVEAASGAIAALGMLAGGLLSGTKLVELFIIFSILAVPQLASQMRPWPRFAPAVVAVVVSLVAAVSIRGMLRELDDPNAVRGRDYAAMAAWLGPRPQPPQMVGAPWDDMPGLFAFGGDQRYMAGFNVQFLRDQDQKRFEAYALFYRGVITDPERAMETFFDDARIVLVRRQPHQPGEPALTARLAASPAFEELAPPVTVWRVFRRTVPAPTGAPR